MAIDLSTQYGGLTLRSPLIVGACPLTAEEQTRIAIVSAGAGAIVLPSLFEEQVVVWNARQGNTLSLRERGVVANARRLQVAAIFADAESYLNVVEQASSQASIPVIASINGQTADNWLEFASKLQAAGAAAIELNVYQPNPNEYRGPREVEDTVVDFAATIHKVINIPLFVKLHRQYTSVSHLARRLLLHAEGLALFGRKPEVDIRLDDYCLTADWGLTVAGSISDSIGSIMQVHSYCPEMSLAATGGIGSPGDLIKTLLAGADVAMVSSAVVREGPHVIRTLLDGLVVFLECHRLPTLEDLKAKRPITFASADERADYIKAVSSRGHVRSGSQIKDRVIHGDRWGHPAM